MKSNNLKEKSTKELTDSLKAVKIISTALILVITLLLSFTIYGMLFKDNNSTFIALFAVGISCGAILPLQFMTMKKIKEELNFRK